MNMNKSKKRKVIRAGKRCGFSAKVVALRNSMNHPVYINRHRMAGFHQINICRLFSDYDKLICDLVKGIPLMDIPLFIVQDLPFFIKNILEDRLKIECPLNNREHAPIASRQQGEED
jgi:hypothetical protein